MEALVHIGLGYALCRAFGVIGAAETALIASVVLEGCVLVPALYRKLEMHLAVPLLRLALSHVIPVIVAGTVGWALSHGPVSSFVDHHGRPIDLVVVVAAGLAIVVPYYAVLAFTGMRRPERESMVAWARTRLRPGSVN
jgi:peptidoglycan biosynthesis protein MviN/MurJ (putative lipid II flippase)